MQVVSKLVVTKLLRTIALLMRNFIANFVRILGIYKYYPHMLTGNYAGFMECHIEGDFLLIWFDHETDQIDLVRLGFHSELFKQ